MAKKKPSKSVKPKGKNQAGPTGPSTATIKRLFGLSSNRCAFPDCTNVMIHSENGTVIGQVCHIEGEKPRAPRHNKKQTPKQRHAFENLILMCGIHHKLIDDRWQKYPKEKLFEMKADHEASAVNVPKLSETQAKRFIANTIQHTVVNSKGQKGGQTAATINNTYYYQGDAQDEEVAIEANIHVGSGVKAVGMLGSVGVCLDVVCRSKRPAKIRKALLAVEGEGFAAAVHFGFGKSFQGGIPGLPECLTVDFVRLSTPNHENGNVLERDDVCHFILPFWANVIAEFLNRPAEDVSIRIEFFDGSQRKVLEGEHLQSTLKTFFEQGLKKRYRAEGTAHISVKVSATSADTELQEGEFNCNTFSFTGISVPEALQKAKKWPLTFVPMIVEQNGQFSIGCMLRNTTTVTYESIVVVFVAKRSMLGPKNEKNDVIGTLTDSTEPFKPGAVRQFFVAVDDFDTLRKIVKSQKPEEYGFVVDVAGTPLFGIRSADIDLKAAIEHIEALTARAKEGKK
jgi:hypothetical protein